MNPDPSARSRIEALIASQRVVLFMKGQRDAPQCGFSARVCQILDQLLPDYATVDVLADPALRDEVKRYSEWPTIPQLYVDGSFVGGCDILQEMSEDGSLFETLGLERPKPASLPHVEFSEAAIQALGRLAAEQPAGRSLHLAIDARWQHALFFGEDAASDLVVEAGELRLGLDPVSASRAEGLRIDAEGGPEGPAFRIDNPNAPRPKVQQLAVRELKQRLDAGAPIHLFDVRTPEERAIAHIPGARLLDEEATRAIARLDRATPLVFHCHHGGRSHAAAEHFAAQGFLNVANVVGGIDAWSQEVDPSVPRY